MQSKLESGGCVRISEKTTVFATALRTSFIRYKENERTEKKLLSTVLKKRQSRYFPFELTGYELYWQGWGSKGSKLKDTVVAKLEGKSTQSKLGPLS